MSVGTVHVVNRFDSAKSQALDFTQRLVKIGRKNTEKTVAANGGIELQSDCVSVPQITVSADQRESIKDLILAMIEDGQDSLIRSLVDSGKNEVHDAEINFDCVVNHLIVMAASKRLKKETIVAWFNTEVYVLFKAYSEPRYGIVAGGLPATEAQVKKLEQSCNAWRDLFAGVAGRGLIEEKKITALQSVISKLELTDSVAKKVSARLVAMVAVHASQVGLDDALNLDFMSA